MRKSSGVSVEPMVAIVSASAAVTCGSNQRKSEGLRRASEAAARRSQGKEEAAEEARAPSLASREEGDGEEGELLLACVLVPVRRRRSGR